MIDAFRYTPTELYEKLDSSSTGLTRADAGIRTTKYGRNELPEKKPGTYIQIFLRQFKSPLIYILFGAAVFVTLFGDYAEALVILAVLVINSVIGAFQEGKAQNTLRALKKFATTETVVMRDGKETVQSDTVLVPGDIVILKEGDKVPADGRVVSLVNLAVDESALTGESEAVHKVVDILQAEELPTADQKNMLFKGTYITKGSAVMLVIATGTHTVVGQISTQLATLDTEVPLKAQIESLSRLIIKMTAVIAVLILVLGLVRGMSIADVVGTIVGVAVSVIPEGLPVVVTLILAIGVVRMSKKNALVKNLQSVEALGQADIVAVDKTGTLTLNQMVVSRLYVPHVLHHVSGSGYEPMGTVTSLDGEDTLIESAVFEEIGRIAALLPMASVGYSDELSMWDRLSGDPTEAALSVLGRKILGEHDVSQYRTLLEVPFESETKYSAKVFNHQQHGTVLYIGGAPETILGFSSHHIVGASRKLITKKDLHEYALAIEDMAKEGLRVVALARRDMTSKERFDPESISKLTLMALVGITDSVREDVPKTIAQAQAAGVRVVMITGDHVATAEAIGRQVGIISGEMLAITGEEFISLGAQEQRALLSKIGVFARVSPQHKLVIVEAYQRAGMIISMTGDGVNDALSLAAADLGVAMGKRGTEVAKESADIVLVDDRFGSMVDAIEEGRSIYRTIQKVILYLLSTNLGGVFFILLVLVIGMPLTLTATQIIWLNFVTEGFLVIAFAFEPNEQGLLTPEAKKDSKGITNPTLITRLAVMGVTMTVGTLLTAVVYRNSSLLATMVLLVLVVFQWYNVFNARSDRWELRKFWFGSNPFLGWALLLVVFLQVAAMYWGPLQRFLGLAPIGWKEWAFALVCSGLIFLTDALTIRILRPKKTR